MRLCDRCGGSEELPAVPLRFDLTDDDQERFGDPPEGDVDLCAACRDGFFRAVGHAVVRYGGEWYVPD